MAGGVDQYRSRLRSAVRGLWTGALDYYDAWDVFDIAIRSAFTQAYHDGAASVGILPSELTPDEKIELRSMIQRETEFIDGFLTAIEEQAAEGGNLGPLFNRIEGWLARYQELYTKGQMTAKDNPKLRWQWTPGKDHCSSCTKLNNKVKRQTQWAKANLYPQCPDLECMQSAGGVTVCGCEFVPTDEPLSKGPLPKA